MNVYNTPKFVYLSVCLCLSIRLSLVVVQLLSHMQLLATPWTAACQASCWSLCKLISIESMMPSNHLILCCPLLLLPSVFPIIRVLSNESALCNNPSVPTLFLLVLFVFSRDSFKGFILCSLWYLASLTCESVSCSVMFDPLQPQRLQPTRLFCPWNFPGKNTGVGCHSFLQGIFPTQELKLHLSHCRQILYHLGHHLAEHFRLICAVFLFNRCFNFLSSILLYKYEKKKLILLMMDIQDVSSLGPLQKEPL